MTSPLSLREALRSADPFARDGGLSGDDVSRMRRTVVAAASEHQSIAWTVSVPLGVALAAVITAGVWTVRRIEPASRTPAAAASARNPNPPVDLRQLHFATSGGTRVIWIFNRELELR